MKDKFIDYYMGIAELTSRLSYGRRLKVGAVLVKGNQIIGTGYNGMPSGWDNNCEHEVYNEVSKQVELKTKPQVLHAESNALMKVARSTENSEGAILFCTHSPCIECAKLIYQAGIKQVYYRESYRNEDGLDFLKQGNVGVNQHTNST